MLPAVTSSCAFLLYVKVFAVGAVTVGIYLTIAVNSLKSLAKSVLQVPLYCSLNISIVYSPYASSFGISNVAVPLAELACFSLP